MIVVSDTSPITNLAAIGKLRLLQGLFASVTIPEAVVQELAACKPDTLGYVSVPTVRWLYPMPVEDRSLVLALSASLDLGEAEAIALATEAGAGLLLVDEHRARRAAQRLGLNTLGVLGILVMAKRAGLVTCVKTLLDALVSEAGFYVGTDLYLRVLREVSED